MYKAAFWILALLSLSELLFSLLWREHALTERVYSPTIAIYREIGDQTVLVSEKLYLDGYTYNRIHSSDLIWGNLFIAFTILTTGKIAERREAKRQLSSQP